jgi:riboflavin kinase / FMN adenylyltransferase
MYILEQHEKLPENVCSVVSVGNFDGVHHGHQRLIKEVVTRAKLHSCASVLITFDPHTRQVLNPDLFIQLLTTFHEKALLIEKEGIDYLVRIPFTPEFSHQSPEYFIENVLYKQLHAAEWVMGEGHGIGKDRIGTKNFLHKLLCKYHIIPFTADLLMHSETIVSSTQIRVNIVQGRIAEAIEMLGYPYLIASMRIPGLKIGTQLGFPTLNFAGPPSQKVLPPTGVYAAELEYNGQFWPGALYFGDCPTFTDRTTHLEFHALSTDGHFPEIGEEGMIWLHSFIRNDRAFPTKEELTQQIENDVKMIKHFFNEERRHAINKGT